MSISLIFIFTRVIGQTYVPMPMANCYWQMSDNKSCYWADNNPQNTGSSFIYKVYPNNDTIIGSTTYVKFYSDIITNTISGSCFYTGGGASGYWGAVRQDTLGRKIFFISPNQTSEVLLYNFNYNVGDSVKTKLGTINPPPPGMDKYRIITSIVNQSFSDGICRRVFYLKPYVFNNISFYSYFIEGIGNNSGLNWQIQGNIGGNPPHDYTNETWNSQLTINNLAIIQTTPNNCPQDVGLKNNFINKNLHIYPNPAHSEITLEISGSSNHDFEIMIFDILGNEISKTQANVINISELLEGVYFIKYVDKFTGQIITSKFVKN